jgi:hypothetical protein
LELCRRVGNPSRIDIKEGIYFSNCQQIYDTFKQGRRKRGRIFNEFANSCILFWLVELVPFVKLQHMMIYTYQPFGFLICQLLISVQFIICLFRRIGIQSLLHHPNL